LNLSDIISVFREYTCHLYLAALFRFLGVFLFELVALSEIWRKFMRWRHQNDDDACKSVGGDNIVDVYCNQEFMFSARSLSSRRKVVFGPRDS